MALRNLTARMQTPAAAAPRLPPSAPRIAPPAGTRPSFYATFQGPHTSLAKQKYRLNLQILDGLKKEEEYFKTRVRILELGRTCLSWSFKLLMPLPMAATIMKVTR
uniref:Uncharacterized protein n=1 Tax=Avena sativa TaxID=4498 RepID=A0ACD5T7B2_AVESA